MSDRPDYTLPVSIEAYTIETLPIDIKTQTLGTVAIDISAQSVGKIAVNIAASAITLNVAIQSSVATIDVDIGNVAVSTQDVNTLLNPGFDLGEVGWKLLNGAVLNTAEYADGNACLELPNEDASAESVPPNPPIPTDNIEIITVKHHVDDTDDEGGVTIRYSDGTYNEEALTNTSVGYQTHSISFTAGKYISRIEFWVYSWVSGNKILIDTISLAFKSAARTDVVSSITLNVDITAQTVGNIAIDIAAQTVGNINVDIKAQTVDLNIKTSGGVNIIIDKLTTAAYTEDRMTYSNDNGVTAPTAPPNSLTIPGANEAPCGKHFSRQLMGLIRNIKIYCRNTTAAAKFISIEVARHPKSGYVAWKNFMLDASSDWAWRGVDFKLPWAYDSLYIFVHNSSDAEAVAGVEIGYDTATPPDRIDPTSNFNIEVDASYDHRIFIKAEVEAQSVKVLPIGGTVNAVIIPSTVSELTERCYASLDGGANENPISLYGTGRVHVQIRLKQVAGEVTSSQMKLKWEVDGYSKEDTIYYYALSVGNQTKTLGIISFGIFDDVNHEYQMAVTAPIPFKRMFKLTIYNTAAAGNTISVDAAWLAETLG